MVLSLVHLLNALQVASIGVGFVWLLEGALVFAVFAVFVSVLIVLAERRLTKPRNLALP